MKIDILIVGAGFAGCVLAERFASAGKSVLIVEKRHHIGGNAYDEFDRSGVLVHRYGPHIFHTSSASVTQYLSRFTGWIPYEHRVLAMLDGRLYPIPINRTTVNMLYGLSLDEQGTAEFFDRVRELRDPVLTSEDAVLSTVGRDLCEKFFRGYTLKQWGMDLSELSADVAARIPVRTNSDDRYFTDPFQKMPSEGYTKMFERMLDHPNIRLELGVDFTNIRKSPFWKFLVFSGPIDEYFEYCYGRLPYRSLRFEHVTLPGVCRFQEVGTVNYPNDHEFTRITEFKHMTGQQQNATAIVREYPCNEGEPYYPIPCPDSQRLYGRYSELAVTEPNVIFAGRLAKFRYDNMDHAVAQALDAFYKVALQTGN